MALTIRSELPDREEYYRLFQSTGWDPEGRWDPEVLHKALRNSWHVACIYVDGELAASGRIVSDGVIQCLICDCIVLPAYQSRGLGTAILEHLLERCKAGGIGWVQLNAARGKAGFYERFGFQSRPADGPGMSLYI